MIWKLFILALTAWAFRGVYMLKPFGATGYRRTYDDPEMDSKYTCGDVVTQFVFAPMLGIVGIYVGLMMLEVFLR